MSTLKTNSITDVNGKPLVNNSGGIIQVVSTVKTDPWSGAGGATTWYAVTGLTASITPTTTSSKILVQVMMTVSSGYWEVQTRLTKNGSVLNAATGDAAGSRSRATTSSNEYQAGSVGYGQYNPTIIYLDSPATTSTTTYGVELNGYSSFTIGLNQNVFDTTDRADYYARTAASITLMEVVG